MSVYVHVLFSSCLHYSSVDMETYRARLYFVLRKNFREYLLMFHETEVSFEMHMKAKYLKGIYGNSLFSGLFSPEQ